MRYRDPFCVDRGRIIEVHLPNRTLIVSKDTGMVFGIGSIALNGCVGHLLKSIGIVGKGCAPLVALAEVHREEECPPEALQHLIEVL